jgi:tape measure domain-containing protein
MTISIIAEINSQRAQQGARDFNSALASMRSGVAQGVQSLNVLRGGFLIAAAGAAAAAVALVSSGKAAIKAADDYQSLTARLAILAKEGTTAAGLLDGIQEAANRARAPVGTLADIYRRNANALSDLGKSEAEGIRLAETLAKVTKISGVSAVEASSAMIQLSQAITSGKFQGDEFRSVAENLPEVLRILERQTGKTAKQLREMAEAGQLSGKVLVQALLNAGGEIDQKFSRMPKTVGEAFEQLKSQISLTFGEIAAQTGVSQKFAEVFDQMRAAVTSPAFASGARAVADTLAFLGETAKTVGSFLAEARIQYIAWTTAISESSVYKIAVAGITALRDGISSLWSTLTSVDIAKTVADTARNSLPNLSDTIDKARELTTQLRAIEQFRGTADANRGAPVRAADNPTKPGKIQFEESELSKQIKLQIESERIRADIARATAEGDKERVRQLETQLETHTRITAEMRKKEPALARELELMIATTNEAERRRDLQRELNQFGTEFATTMFTSLRQSIEDGKRFGEVLGNLALKLADMVVQFAIMKPLAESIGKSIGGFLGAGGVSDASDPFGIGKGGIGSLISGAGSLFGFANGGVFDRPVAMAGAGGFRGVMAEAGPEAIMPLRRGPGGRLGVEMLGGGQSSPANITINIAGDATAETVAKLRAVAREEFARSTPGLVRQAVGAVGDRHRADSGYLRR